MKYKYPQRLLPKYGYRSFGIISGLLYGRLFVVRTTFDDKPAHSVHRVKEFSAEMLPASHFRDSGMSMVLISNIRKKHLRWIVKYKGTQFGDPWDETPIPLRPSKNYCAYNRNRGLFAFKLSDIESVSCIAQLKKNEVKLGEHNITLKVVHKPNRCNFFHSEIVPYGSPVDKTKGDYCSPLNKLSSKGSAALYGSELLRKLMDKIYLENDIKEYTIPSKLYR